MSALSSCINTFLKKHHSDCTFEAVSVNRCHIVSSYNFASVGYLQKHSQLGCGFQDSVAGPIGATADRFEY